MESNMETKPYRINDNEATIVTYNEERIRVNLPTKDILNVSSCRSNDRGETSKSAKMGSASLATIVVHDVLSKPEAENNEPTTKKNEIKIVNETNVCETNASTVIFTEIIEISGIVEQSDEDLTKKVFLETAKVGVVLDANDIEYAIRVGNRNSDNNCPRPIVLKFQRQGLNNIVINAVKQHDSLYKSEDFILDGNTIIPSDINKKGSKDDILCIPNKKSEGINESLELHNKIKDHTQPNIVECNSNKKKEPIILQKQNILNTNKSWSKKESALLKHTGKTKDTNEMSQEEGNEDTTKLEESANILKTKENSTVARQNLTITGLESGSITGILSLSNSKQPATALKKDRHSFDIWNNIATSLQHNGRKDVSVTLDSWDNNKAKSKSKNTDKVFIFGSSENLKLLKTGTKVNNNENSNKFKEPSLRKDENITNKSKHDKKEPPFSKDTNDIKDTNKISQTQCSEKEVMNLKESATNGNKRVTCLQSDRSKVFSIPLESWDNSKSMLISQNDANKALSCEVTKTDCTTPESGINLANSQAENSNGEVCLEKGGCLEFIHETGITKATLALISNGDKNPPIDCKEWSRDVTLTPQTYGYIANASGAKILAITCLPESGLELDKSLSLCKSNNLTTQQEDGVNGITSHFKKTLSATPHESKSNFPDPTQKNTNEEIPSETRTETITSHINNSKSTKSPHKSYSDEGTIRVQIRELPTPTENFSKNIATQVESVSEVLTSQNDGNKNINSGANNEKVTSLLETDGIMSFYNQLKHSLDEMSCVATLLRETLTLQKNAWNESFNRISKKEMTIPTEYFHKQVSIPLEEKSKEELTLQEFGGIIGGANRKEVLTKLENNSIVTTPLVDHGKEVLSPQNDGFEKMIDGSNRKENPFSIINPRKLVLSSQTDNTKVVIFPKKGEFNQVIKRVKGKYISVSTESSSKEMSTPLVEKYEKARTPQTVAFESFIGGARREVCTPLGNNTKIVTTPLVNLGKEVFISRNDAFNKKIDENDKKENPRSVSNQSEMVPILQLDDTLFISPQKDELYEIIDGGMEKDTTISTESFTKQVSTPLVEKSKEALNPQKVGFEGIIGGARRKEVCTPLGNNNKIVTTPIVDLGKQVWTSRNDAFDKMIDENKRKENPTSVSKQSKIVPILQSDHTLVIIPQKDELYEVIDGGKEKDTTILTTPLVGKSKEALTPHKVGFEKIIGGARRKEVCTPLGNNNKIVTTPIVDLGKQVLISRNDAFDKMIDENKKKENPISVSNQSKMVPILQSDHTLSISPQKDELYEIIDGGMKKDTTISTESFSKQVSTPLVEKSKEALTPQNVGFEGIIGGARRKEVCTPLGNNKKIVTTPIGDLGKQVLISRNDAFYKMIDENMKKENPISVSNHSKIVPTSQTDDTKLFTILQKDELYQLIDGDKEKDITISTESSSKEIVTPPVEKIKEILTPQIVGFEGIIGGARRKEVITTLETNNKIVTTPLVDHGKQVLISQNYAFDKMIDENKRKENPISVSNQIKMVPILQSDHTLVISPQKDELYEVIDGGKKKDTTISTESFTKQVSTPLVEKSKEALTPQKVGFEGIIGGARRKEVCTPLGNNNKIVTTPILDLGKQVLTSRNDAFDKMIDENKKNENPTSGSKQIKMVPILQSDHTLSISPQKDELYEVIDGGKENTTISTESFTKQVTTPLVEKSKEALTPQKVGFEGIIGGVRKKEVFTQHGNNKKTVTTPIVDLGKQVLTPRNDAFDKIIDENKKKENPLSVSNHSKIVPTSQTDDTKLFTIPQKDELYQVIDEDKEKDITISTESSSKENLTPLVEKSKEILTPQKVGFEGIIGGARRKEVINTLETNNEIVKTPLVDHRKQVLISQNDGFDGNKRKKNQSKTVPTSQTENTKVVIPQNDEATGERDKANDVTVRIGSKPGMSQQEIGSDVNTPIGDNEEPDCAICQAPCQNKAHPDICRHFFCFICLSTWSQVKPECPLCKRPFKSIIYNIRAGNQYDKFLLDQNNTGVTAEGNRFSSTPEPSLPSFSDGSSLQSRRNFGRLFETPPSQPLRRPTPEPSPPSFLDRRSLQSTRIPEPQPSQTLHRDVIGNRTPTYSGWDVQSRTPPRPQSPPSYVLPRTRSQVLQKQPQYSPPRQTYAANSFDCDVCGRVCASKAGLMSHQRMHARNGETASWRGRKGTYGLPDDYDY